MCNDSVYSANWDDWDDWDNWDDILVDEDGAGRVSDDVFDDFIDGSLIEEL